MLEPAREQLDLGFPIELGQSGDLPNPHHERHAPVGLELSKATLDHEAIHQAVAVHGIDHVKVRPLDQLGRQ